MKHICKSISQPGKGHFETSALKKKKKKKAFPEISFKHLTLNFLTQIALKSLLKMGGVGVGENAVRTDTD